MLAQCEGGEELTHITSLEESHPRVAPRPLFQGVEEEGFIPFSTLGIATRQQR
jgi:hypothetical protein